MGACLQRCLSTVSATFVFLLLPICAGCLHPNTKSNAEEKPAAETAAGTPEQLLGDIQVAQREAQQTAQLYASAGGAFRRDLLRKHIENGLEAADRLLAHADVDQHQAQTARQANVELLGRGTANGWDGYEDRLATFLEQLKNEHPGRSETALADAILLERQVIHEEANIDQALKALKAHVATYAEHSTGLMLFRRLVEQLVADQRISEARKCCQTALRQFGNNAQTAPFRRLLAQTMKEEQAQRRREAQVARIKARLGGHSDGCFVIYVHPSKVSYGSPVDYHVSMSLEKAVAYVGSLNKKMEWEVVRRFPRTPEGGKKARALCNELIKKNTFSVPVVR